jgi:DNA-binding transcriptional MerR regulator
VRTTKKGDRLYTPAQIHELCGIYQLVKEKGFTLAGAKAKLKEEKKGPIEAVNLKQSLLKLRSQLSAIRTKLS